MSSKKKSAAELERDLILAAGFKKCGCCQEFKQIRMFTASRGRYGDLAAYCKKCVSDKADNKNRKAYKDDWYQKNKEKCIARQTKRYLEKKDEVAEYKAEYYAKNKSEVQEAARTYYHNNRDVISVKVKLRSARPEVREKRRKYILEYWHKNKEKNKHIHMWRRLLQNCLRAMNQRKTGRTLDMLGYSSVELKAHLESLWLPKMNWGNYGDWHIDHIRAVIDFPPDTDTKIVNALSNLRPMWATTRVLDGVTYEGNLNKGCRSDA